MRQNRSLKFSLIVVGAVGTIVSLLIICFLTLGFTQSSFAKSSLPEVVISSQNLIENNQVSTTEQINLGRPIRIKIPKIKVNAIIESVGFTTKGEMGLPKVPKNAAWLKYSARPGEAGSAIISGHVNWWTGASAVFVNLSKLKIGDKIMVIGDKGALVTFVVRKIQRYAQNKAVPEAFSSSDGKAHLNLVTCIGAWNKVTKSYSQRLVVFADRE